MPIISVIIPIYNVELYLRRCVDSILSQTFHDFELILVDDGSPDNCPAICDEYAAKDHRIHVIHQKNQGASAARNAALDYVLSKDRNSWLTFVDSDDWIHPQMLEFLYNAVIKYGTQVAICDHQIPGAHITLDHYSQSSSALWNSEEYFITNNLNATTPWGKLYHKTCFDQLRFPVGIVHEDEYITYQTLFQCKSVAVIPLPLYIHYSNPQGVTQTENRLKRLYALSAYEEQLAFFKRIGAQKAYSYRISNYYIELVLFPKKLDSSKPQERSAKQSLISKRKYIFSQMNPMEKKIAYQYLYPRTFTLLSRITRCIELLKAGGIHSLISALKNR